MEEVSAKTGSFKKFAVFAKMLVAAVVDASESVFVDLLTYADLERLKRERSAGRGEANGLCSASATRRDASPASQKRYLILTRADEFDRTHYPLPLLFEDDPSPQALQATVERLRRENQRLKAAGVEEEGARAGDGDARAENAELRKKVEYLERRLVAGGDARGNPPDVLATLPPAYAQVERLQAEVKALTRDAVDAKRALDDTERERRGLETALAGAESSKRRVLAKKQRELDDAREDIARRRDVERELRTKVKDLETQCDGLERRLRASGGGYAPPPALRQPPVQPRVVRGALAAVARGALARRLRFGARGGWVPDAHAGPVPVARARPRALARARPHAALAALRPHRLRRGEAGQGGGAVPERRARLGERRELAVREPRGVPKPPRAGRERRCQPGGWRAATARAWCARALIRALVDVRLVAGRSGFAEGSRRAGRRGTPRASARCGPRRERRFLARARPTGRAAAPDGGGRRGGRGGREDASRRRRPRFLGQGKRAGGCVGGDRGHRLAPRGAADVPEGGQVRGVACGGGEASGAGVTGGARRGAVYSILRRE